VCVRRVAAASVISAGAASTNAAPHFFLGRRAARFMKLGDAKAKRCAYVWSVRSLMESDMSDMKTFLTRESMLAPGLTQAEAQRPFFRPWIGPQP
jgi:hypothetical protein